MLRKSLLTVVGSSLLVLGLATPATAQPMTITDTKAGAGGVDVSWPQCGKSLPAAPAFAIIGVNDGVANTTNPCLQAQLAWAQGARGEAGVPRVSLYVNTGNPGFAGSGKRVAWPTSNSYKGTTVMIPDIYGQTRCNGRENYSNLACAYMYGWGLAYDDATSRGIVNPGAYTWWLDVETVNTWNIVDQQANAAVLEGMNDYFTHGLGAKTGLYTSFGDWFQIVGALPRGSVLDDLNVWYPLGVSTRAAAFNAYKGYPSPTGGQIVMVQYIEHGVDRNYFGQPGDIDTLTVSQAQPTLLNTLFGFLIPRLSN